MLTIIILLIAAVVIFAFTRISKKSSPIQQGDLAMIRPNFTEQYDIPENNVLHVLDVDEDVVKVEFINFKNGKYQQEELSKDVVRKVQRRSAA